MMGTMGKAPASEMGSAGANIPIDQGLYGADDGIRTRDPHLGNVKRTVRRVRLVP
jgi:hypothetical protein